MGRNLRRVHDSAMVSYRLNSHQLLASLISLAISLQSNKGAYGVLLDLGVSRCSRILTG